MSSNLEHKTDEDGNNYLHLNLSEGKTCDTYYTTESVIYRPGDKPSIISYDKEGKVEMEIWNNDKGQVSRLEGPATVDHEGESIYFIDAVRMTKEEHVAHPDVIKFNKLKTNNNE